MRHPISKHCVVAKVLLLKDLQEAWMVRQVEQEVAILSRLKHANVIQYIATFQATQHGHTCRHGRATACRLQPPWKRSTSVPGLGVGRRTLERSPAAAQAARWHVAPAVRLCQTPTMLRLLASGRRAADPPSACSRGTSRHCTPHCTRLITPLTTPLTTTLSIPLAPRPTPPDPTSRSYIPHYTV